MRDLLVQSIIYFDIFVLVYFLALNFSYILLLVLAAERLFYYKIRRQIKICQKKDHALIPGVAILAPAYNEEPTIVESVKSLLAIEYPDLEIIVINDGSKDKTLEVLKKNFLLFPAPRQAQGKLVTKEIKATFASAVDSRLLVIDKANGGKADSLNAGIDYARSRLFVAIDADSLIEKDAIYRIVQPYLERDAKVVGVGGIVRVANGCRIKNGEVLEARLSRRFLPAIQTMEYIRAFLCGRTGWNRFNSLMIISGAFGLFDRASVIEAGGYRTDLVGEDMEMVFRLHRRMRERKKPYKLLFQPDTICWTQVPETLKVLGRQRNRWHRGLMETVFAHLKMLFNPRYGSAGLVGMPFIVAFEMLGPMIEAIGYVTVIVSFMLGWINYKFVLLFLGLAILFGIVLSLFSLLLEEFTMKKYQRPWDIIKLFLMAVLENLGYRQLNTWWRFKGTIDFFMKKKDWGEMQKKSFVD